MKGPEFLENKVEEALQLLSAQNELLEKQVLMMEEFLARMANMQAEQNLSSFLQDEKNGDDLGAF